MILTALFCQVSMLGSTWSQWRRKGNAESEKPKFSQGARVVSSFDEGLLRLIMPVRDGERWGEHWKKNGSERWERMNMFYSWKVCMRHDMPTICRYPALCPCSFSLLPLFKSQIFHSDLQVMGKIWPNVRFLTELAWVTTFPQNCSLVSA